MLISCKPTGYCLSLFDVLVESMSLSTLSYGCRLILESEKVTYSLISMVKAEIQHVAVYTILKLIFHVSNQGWALLFLSDYVFYYGDAVLS